MNHNAGAPEKTVFYSAATGSALTRESDRINAHAASAVPGGAAEEDPSQLARKEPELRRRLPAAAAQGALVRSTKDQIRGYLTDLHPEELPGGPHVRQTGRI